MSCHRTPRARLSLVAQNRFRGGRRSLPQLLLRQRTPPPLGLRQGPEGRLPSRLRAARAGNWTPLSSSRPPGPAAPGRAPRRAAPPRSDALLPTLHLGWKPRRSSPAGSRCSRLGAAGSLPGAWQTTSLIPACSRHSGGAGEAAHVQPGVSRPRASRSAWTGCAWWAAVAPAAGGPGVHSRPLWGASCARAWWHPCQLSPATPQAHAGCKDSGPSSTAP